MDLLHLHPERSVTELCPLLCQLSVLWPHSALQHCNLVLLVEFVSSWVFSFNFKLCQQLPAPKGLCDKREGKVGETHSVCALLALGSCPAVV